MTAWVDLTTVRSFIGNTKPEDTAAIQAAIDLGCEKVDELCGPTMTTSITEHVRSGWLSARAVELTAVADWRTDAALTLDDYYAEGQVLARKDGARIASDLTVTYTAGSATAPAWAVSAACLIAKQWFTSRLRPNLNDPTTLAGFLVPNQATEIMASHVLAPGGFA